MKAGEVSRFISFEGGEGAGKSTQARLLADALRKRGHAVLLTREPGGTTGGEAIRRLLVEGGIEDWSPRTEALLHFAARAEHLARAIRPALEAGQWVISDRFADSTIAYQGYGQGVDLDWLAALRRLVVGSCEPGLTLLLDLDQRAGLARAETRQRYERMSAAFHERLAAGFRAIAAASPERCRRIDAAQPLAAVAAEVNAAVMERYGIGL